MRDQTAIGGQDIPQLSKPLREIMSRHSADEHDSAVQALAREVIARLDRQKTLHQRAVGGLEPEDVAVLCDALLSHDEAAAEGLVMRAVSQGMAVDAVHLGYIAEAARMMGDRWNSDQATAAEVIIGAGRIYGIMRKLRTLFVSAREQRSGAFRAVLATAPGETHTLGLTMAADFMRRRGWQVDVKAGLSHEVLVDQIGHEPYPVIGLSASDTAMVFPLARLVVALRVSNPGAWIMVGGRIVDQMPDVMQRIDADACANDLETALAHMEAVVQPGQVAN